MLVGSVALAAYWQNYPHCLQGPVGVAGVVDADHDLLVAVPLAVARLVVDLFAVDVGHVPLAVAARPVVALFAEVAEAAPLAVVALPVAVPFAAHVPAPVALVVVGEFAYAEER